MATPVVFIHGYWLHSSSWNPWIDLFREAGYDPIAPEWPGGAATVEECRANPDAVAAYGLTEVADHYAGIIASLPEKPVVIGHSFGGLLTQNLVGRGITAAGVAINPAPIKGVLVLQPSALRNASVALRNPANRSRAVSLTPEQFRYGFANAVSLEESRELYDAWTIPSPGLPMFQVATAPLNPNSATKVETGTPDRGPLLITAAGHDHAVPAAISKATYRRYAKSPAITEYLEFTDRGHSLIVDHGWHGVAEASLDFLRKHSIT
jgi:pimeloyl-ACP methyl ester carboxylesterase